MIRVENLVKKFGDLTAVDNISFEVKQGEIFAFLGPNGAGKTTTIKTVVAGIAPLSSFARSDRGIVSPAASLSAGAGVRARPGVSESRERQLPAIRSARCYRHEHPVHFRVFGNRVAL